MKYLSDPPQNDGAWGVSVIMEAISVFYYLAPLHVEMGLPRSITILQGTQGYLGPLGGFLSILKMSTRESQRAQGKSWGIPGGQALVGPLLAEAGKFSPVADWVMLVLAPTKEIGDDSAQQRGPMAVLCQEVPHVYLPQPLHLARTDHVMGCQEAGFWTPLISSPLLALWLKGTLRETTTL